MPKALPVAVPAAGLVLRAGKRMLRENKEILLLAALTDRSFEDGTSREFTESISSMGVAGLPPPQAFRLGLGINGLLQDALSGTRGVRHVARNPKRVPDHEIELVTSSRRGWIETKQLHDLIEAKHYLEVAEDRAKLLAARLAGKADELLQVCVFIQLPNFQYPAGRWYGNKDCPSRSEYEYHVCIASQYGAVQDLLGPSSRPTGKPHILRLGDLADQPVAKFAGKWIGEIFQPSSSWCFDPHLHLRDAAIGMAVWSW